MSAIHDTSHAAGRSQHWIVPDNVIKLLSTYPTLRVSPNRGEWNDMRVKKAIIPAAGLGTRILPATKAQPKEMLPIVDKPTIQYIVEEAVAAGIEDIIIISGRGKRAIE